MGTGADGCRSGMKVAVLAGDGIGPEVVSAALTNAPAGFETISIDVSADRYLATGDLLRDEELETIKDSDALFFGAIGDPRVPDGVLERGVLLHLRRELDLYVNLRPFPELDLVFVRENSEGAYSGQGFRKEDRAEEHSINTRRAVERCARFAFELAGQRRGQLTWVHKTNVLVHAGALWRETVAELAADHAGIEVSYEHADAAAYHLVRDPARYDVILTDNLFGDVLSDLAAGVGDGLGSAASANLHPDPTTRPTRCVGLFEPVHGSAPDIAGTNTANPRAAMRALQMLVTSVKEKV